MTQKKEREKRSAASVAISISLFEAYWNKERDSINIICMSSEFDLLILLQLWTQNVEITAKTRKTSRRWI